MPNSTWLFPMTFSPTVEPSDTGDHGEIDMYNNYPHKISDMGYTVVASLLTVTWVSGTLLNIFSLVVFLSNKRLRSPTNMFVMSLNFCDLCMSCFGTFMAMTSSWNGHWLYGRTGCLFEGFMVYFLGMASMYLLCAISVDRYVVIAKPLLGAKINHMVAGLSIAACWIGGFMWAAFPLFGWNEYVLEGAGVSCSVVWETSNSNYTSYIFVIFVFCLVIPLAVMGFSYYGVFMTIKSMSKGRDKTSRIAKRNMKVEKKMAKTIFVMLAGYLGCWMPYTIFSFVVVFGGADAVNAELATYPAILAKSQGILNPLIYVASNKQFRQAFYAMLPWTGLREALEKGEEDKPDSDESGDEEADDNKKGKGKGKKKDKKKGGGNKVAPGDEVDQAEEKTVVEYLEVPPNTCKANGESPGGESLKVEEVEMAVPGTSAP